MQNTLTTDLSYRQFANIFKSILEIFLYFDPKLFGDINTNVYTNRQWVNMDADNARKYDIPLSEPMVPHICIYTHIQPICMHHYYDVRICWRITCGFPSRLTHLNIGLTQWVSTNVFMSAVVANVAQKILTHWGRVTHICVSKLTTISLDNGLSPGRRKAIIWTNAGILLTGPLGTNFNEILIDIYIFVLKNAFENDGRKWQPSCPSLNVLKTLRYLIDIDLFWNCQRATLVISQFWYMYIMPWCRQATKHYPSQCQTYIALWRH